ncbi:MAG: FKBP-type peptidyl-prolyl cis-trans isomerase [Ilumatobacter sp.]
MRRTLAITTIAALSLAACGSSDEAADEAPVETSAEESASDSDVGSQNDADTESENDEDGADDVDSTTPPDAEPAPEKPEVELPDEIPTELVRTVLSEGDGEPADIGDSVIVDYVGVRSADGVEFDNSYGRGQPFTVALGAGTVIPGWEDGLIGSRAGERVQLDIPSDQAYGDQARSDVIEPNTALTFVIDVRDVIEGVDPADIPNEPGIPLSDVGVDDTEFVDVIEGDGDELALGDTALIRYVNFRADNGAILETNWGEPLPVPFTEDLLPGLLEGMDGMQVGDRRAITIPPEDGFGPEGNPQGGLPAETDIIFLVELVALG